MRASIVLRSDSTADATATVAALVQQTHADWELIVVGHAALPVPRIAMKCVNPPTALRESLAAWRNAGLALAAAPMVAFLEAGAIPAPDWLANLLREFDRSPDIVAVSGLPIEGFAKSITREGAVRPLSLPYSAYLVPTADPTFCPSATNIAYRAVALRAHGGFGGDSANARLDSDLWRTMIDSAERVAYCPTAQLFVHGTPIAAVRARPILQAVLQPTGRKQWPTAEYLPNRLMQHTREVLSVAFVNRTPGQSEAAFQLHEYAVALAAAGHTVHEFVEGTPDSVPLQDSVWRHAIECQPHGPWDRTDRTPADRDALAWAGSAHDALKALSRRIGFDAVCVPIANAEGLFCLLDDSLRTISIGTDIARTQWEQLCVAESRQLLTPLESVRRAWASARNDRHPLSTVELLPYAFGRAVESVASHGLRIALVADGDEYDRTAKLLTERFGATIVPSVVGAELLCWLGKESTSLEQLRLAFVQGVPVVATARGIACEWIMDGVNGLLAYPGSGSSLCGLVARLLQQPQLRRRLLLGMQATVPAPGAIADALVGRLRPAARSQTVA